MDIPTERLFSSVKLCKTVAADAFSYQQQNESVNDVFQGNHLAEKVWLLKNVNLFETLRIITINLQCKIQHR